SDEVPAGRPHPYMIQLMMNKANITDAKRVIKVGDTEVDIQEGKNANCLYSVGVTTGAFTREELEPYEPSFIIDDIKEIIGIVQNS
ncbi:MAG: HAD hydrolase-like protein, partial [Bacteroidota bacterium]|nr:HAD hydrolase-like protein [Bacteroidota bacterium]